MAPTQLLDGLHLVRRKLRALTTLLGVGMAASAFVGLLLAIIALDYLLDLSAPARIFLMLLAAGVLISVIFRNVVRPLAAQLRLTDVAGRLEESFPQFEDRLRSTINFLDVSPPGSRTLQRMTIDQTAAMAEDIDLASAIDPRPAYRWGGGGAACLVGFMLLSMLVGASYRDAAFDRLLSPFGNHPWPKRTQIGLVGSLPTRIASGDKVDLRMRLQRGDKPSARATVFYQYGAGPVQREFMSRDADGDFSASIDAAPDESTLKIWMQSGDDEMHVAPIQIVPRLEIQSVRADITPPAYAGAGETSVDLARAPATMVIGSRIAIYVRFNKPLDPAHPPTLLADGASADSGAAALPTVQWTSTGGDSADAAFSAADSFRFHLKAVDQDGFVNSGLESYEVIVRPDQMPTVQIENPRSSENRTPVAVIPLQGAADDDYGIAEMTLVVDRLGNNARHWAIPLVRNSAPAPGVAWRQLDKAGDRIPYRMNYGWDLGKLDSAGLQSGDVLEYYLQVRDNFSLDGQTHPPVNSSHLRLTIVSQEQFAQSVADALHNLAHDAAQDKALQVATEHATQRLGSDTQGKFAEADRQIADGLVRQQTTAASTAKEIAGKLDALSKQIDENKSPATDLKAAADAARDQLNAAAENPMKDAAGKIEAARELGSAPTTQSSDASDNGDAANEQASAKALSDAQASQQQAEAMLQKALDQLGNSGDLGQMIDRIAADLAHQQQISGATADIGKQTIGKTPDQLTPDQQAALAKNAADQKALADNVDKDVDQLQKAAAALAKSDPTSSSAMQQAAQTGQEQNVSANMNSAADNAQQNRQGDAQAAQQQAELGLQMMISQMREAQQRQLEELARKLLDVQQQLAGLIKQQAGHNLDDLNLQGAAAVAKIDAKLVASLLSDADRTADHQPPTPELPQLQALQEQTDRNTRDISHGLDDLPDTAEAAEHLNRASEQMQRAIVSLQNDKLADALDPSMSSALTELHAAGDIIDAQKAKADQKIQDKQRETIRQAYVKALADQKQIASDTTALDAAPRGDDGQLSHRDAVRLARLPGAQGELSDRVEKIGQDLSALGSIVYVWANKDIVDSMRQTQGLLTVPNTGAQTQAEEQRIVAQLQAMIDGLAVKPEPKQFADPKSASGGGGGGSSTPRLPGEAELNLLKKLQLAINDNTKQLDQGADKDKSALVGLGTRQNELRDLLDQLLKKSSGGKIGVGPEPTDDVKLPEEADDQNIDDQELEDKLLNAKPEEDQAQDDVNLIGARMSRSHHRLGNQLDPGSVTQKIQDRIIGNLDALIAMARKQESQSSSSASNSNPGQSGQPDPTGAKPDDSQNGGAKQQTASNMTSGTSPAQTSALPGHPAGDADISKPLQERLAEWGQVSPRQRQAIIEGASEKVVEKYKSFVDDYYRSLATKQTDSGQ